MIYFPNAKINLGLSVKKKLSDGFHEIETIMVPVGLCDVLEVVVGESDRYKFSTSGINIQSESDQNLCLKAWEKLNLNYELPDVQIHLHKNIPIGAGLGGGSSDAAFTLKLLKNYCKINAGEEELLKMASEIGNDCPFFIPNKTSLAYDKGQLLKPVVLNLDSYHIVIVFPYINISTQWAYKTIVPEERSKSLIELISLPVNQWKHHIINDFETIVFAKYPEIQNVKMIMYEKGAIYSSLSGSGSAVYGIFEEIPDLRNDFKNYFTWQGQSIG